MKPRKRKPPRRRNVYAAVVRRYGHRIEPSGKVYRRRPKHRNPRQPHDGGFDMSGQWVSTSVFAGISGF